MRFSKKNAQSFSCFSVFKIITTNSFKRFQYKDSNYSKRICISAGCLELQNKEAKRG